MLSLRSSIVRICKIKKSCESVLMCDSGVSQNDDLLPFFLSNLELVMYYNTIHEEDLRKIKVQEYLKSIDFFDKHKIYRRISEKRFL